jgi:type VI secretion system VgrG family protein
MPVTLWLLNDDPDRRRPIHGNVKRLIGQGHTPQGSRLYQLEVVPRLWFLCCTSDCRIFQNQTIPDIIQTIFQEQGLLDFEFRILRADFSPVDYCVQYQETALDFVSRLMEHLGLFYWHEHKADRHLLVIADRNAASAVCQPTEVRISPISGVDELQNLDVECTFRPGRWALNDYDFQSPTRLLRVDSPTTLTVPRMVNHEMYEYPGKFLDQDTGKRLSRLRIELEEAQQRRVFGTGRCAGFNPGYRFAVAAVRGEHPETYLLTEVRHHATAPGAEADGSESTYTNDYVAIPFALPFRPERLTPKPFVRGTQTATVVGPAGENIYCDIYGRVRVQFHWDRRGQRNDQSSCWMRVAQARSGSNYGTLVIPHVGHEVLVSFIEGDPDRPLIIGTVPNALTMPPVGLPGDKDKTVQRDHGNNKIVMQGKAGKESVSMVSPRAVNLFASGRTARPLSSDSYGGSGQIFSVSPNVNNAPVTTTTITSSGTITNTTYPTPAGQTGTGTEGTDMFTIPFYHDQQGLNELWNEWYGTVQSDIDSGFNIPGSGNAASTQGSYGMQDNESANSYLNWGSEGKINCLVLNNNNLWVYGNGNTWINGQVFTKINGGSDVLIEKYSATTVLGDNTTTVVGANESINIVENLSLNVGFNEAFSLAGFTELMLFKIEYVQGMATEYKTLHLKAAAVKAEDNEVATDEADIQWTNNPLFVENVGVGVHDGEQIYTA